LKDEDDIVGQAVLDERGGLPDVDEQNCDEAFPVAAHGTAPPAVVGGDVGRQ
jgi:hypothetical protein